jgi:small subunit ribosomal protein S10e
MILQGSGGRPGFGRGGGGYGAAQSSSPGFA